MKNDLISKEGLLARIRSRKELSKEEIEYMVETTSPDIRIDILCRTLKDLIEDDRFEEERAILKWVVNELEGENQGEDFDPKPMY